MNWRSWEIRRRTRGAPYPKRPNEVVLQLEKKVGNEGEEKFVFDRRILANSKEVVEFDGPLRQINIYPMPKDAEQRHMEEGPLPFLFRMNVAQFKQRYQAMLKPSTQQGTHRLAIYPLQDVDKGAFSVAVLILDARTLQPLSIHTLAPNGKDKQNYYIKDFRANVDLKPEMFAWGPQPGQDAQKTGWRIIENPSPDQVGLQQPSGAGQPQELAPIR